MAKVQSSNVHTPKTELITQGNLFVSPAEFFCGDKVFVSFTFTSDSDAVTELEQSIQLDTLEYLTNEQLRSVLGGAENDEEAAVTISGISVSCAKNASTMQTSVNVKLNCVFWRSGEVKIPELTIPLENHLLKIQFPSVTVSSILEKTGTTSIRGYKGPEIIPGSTYLVWMSVFASLVLLSLLILALVKSKSIALFFKKLSIKHKFYRQYLKTVQSINSLKKLKPSFEDKIFNDVDFCLKIQTAIRDYFALRFSKNIYNMTTEEITRYLTHEKSQNLPDNLVSNFYAVMCKCDTVRFSDFVKNEGSLPADEKIDLLDNTLEIVNSIHKGIPYDAYI